MSKRYPALDFIVQISQATAILIVLASIALAIIISASGFAIGLPQGLPPFVLPVAIILLALMYAIPLYAFGDLLRCLMDIETNTRCQNKRTE